MTTAIGLDFGSGLTKLARCRPDAGNGPAELITWPPTPTAVAFHDLSSEIPGLTDFPAPETGAARSVRCDGFPAMLGPADKAPSFHGRTSGELSREFLRLLFAAAGVPTDKPGNPVPLVVVVPPEPRGLDGPDPGPIDSDRMRTLLVTLRRPPRRMLASPVATILYLRHRSRDLADVTHFIVADAGAAVITLSLCTVEDGRVRVQESARIFGTAPWKTRTPAKEAKESKDRRALLAEALISAIAGEKATPTTSARQIKRWRALENELADSSKRERLDAVLTKAARDPRRFGVTPALDLGDLRATAEQVIAGCEPVAAGASEELTDLIEHWPGPAQSDVSRIVLTGGLMALRPLRTALLSAAGLDPDEHDERSVPLDHDERLSAAARGAALVAAGQADPGDLYPHGLRLLMHRQVGDRLEESNAELSPGTVDTDATDPVFLRDDDGRRLQVKICESGSTAPTSRPIPVELVRGAHAEPALFLSARPPQAGSYEIGVAGGPDGTSIVLEPADGGDPLRFLLRDPVASYETDDADD